MAFSRRLQFAGNNIAAPVSYPQPYPTAATTGVPTGTTLTPSGSLIITTADQTVQNLQVTGDIDVRANNVVIRNCSVTGSIFNWNGAGGYSFTVEDCTVGVAGGFNSQFAIGTENYVARRVHIQGHADGFRIGGSGLPVVIEDSFVELASNDLNDHSDGIQAYGGAGSTVLIRHNTIDQRAVPSAAQTAPIFIPGEPQQGNDGMVSTIQDNLLAGGGFSLRAYGGTFPAITGNKIVANEWQYGPLDVDMGLVTTWADNATVTYNWSTGYIISEVTQL